MHIERLMIKIAWAAVAISNCAMAQVPGPRDPLAFRNSGLYGGFPNSYFVSPSTPFDFFTVQAVPYEGQSSAAWNTSLQTARQAGKRIIAVLHPQAVKTGGGHYGISELTSSSTQADLDRLVDVVDQFLSQVDVNDLHAITLGEENIFWDGREEQLNYLYDRIKANHNVPIYQWHSPSSAGTAPGISGWPNLRADGWVADEYVLDQPNMEKSMRGYIVQQKPVIQTVWAGGEAITSVPFDADRFAEQISVLKKYDIPANFFVWSGVGGTNGYEDEAPAETKAKFQLVLNAVNQAKLDPGPNYQSWDTVSWQTPAIALDLTSNGQAASYAEHYATDRVVRFVNDADITGLASLRWDSSAVELRPRQAGAAEASVEYTFDSPGPVAFVNIRARGFESVGTDGAMWMSVLDSDGNVVRTTQLTDSAGITIGVSGAEFTGRRFKVVYGMSGTAAAADDVLAGIDSIEVNAVIGAQPLFAFERTFDLGDAQEQANWTASIDISTGPNGPQFNPTTVHYNETTNAYEPLATGEVRIEPANDSTNGTGDITLVRRIDTAAGEKISNPVFEVDAHGYSSWGSLVQLWLSTDGINWEVASAPATAGFADQHLIADATGVDGFQDMTSLWLKVRMYDIHGFGNSETQYVHAWNFSLSGLTTTPTPIPEPSVTWMAGLIALAMLGRRSRDRVGS